MAKFFSIIPARTTTDLDFNHYSCLSDFLDRDGDKKECGIMFDQMILCKSPSFRATLSSHLKALVDAVAKTKEQSSGVLTFMAFECLDDEVGARVLGRFGRR